MESVRKKAEELFVEFGDALASCAEMRCEACPDKRFCDAIFKLREATLEFDAFRERLRKESLNLPEAP